MSTGENEKAGEANALVSVAVVYRTSIRGDRFEDFFKIIKMPQLPPVGTVIDLNDNLGEHGCIGRTRVDEHRFDERHPEMFEAILSIINFDGPDDSEQSLTAWLESLGWRLGVWWEDQESR